MAIRPVTYQGASNFKSNLYALEVKSRFIDQTKANGYYKGYGEELQAIVSGNVVTVRSGAFLVQGRLNEIEPGGEAVTVTIQNGQVGYILARIETYHPDDTENCTLVARTGATLASITLTQEDTYQRTAESENKVYELPLYSFSMSGGVITNLVKLITPVEENTRTREIADAAKSVADEAKTTADEAKDTAESAKTIADEAKTTADAANNKANSAKATADEAKDTAEFAASTAETAWDNASTALANAKIATAAATSAKEEADETKAKVDAVIQAAAQLMYPVGSIYMSVVGTNPSALFGGTWAPWGAGRVPVGINTSDTNFSEVEKTGGESTHRLTTSEMPAHNHSGTYTKTQQVKGALITETPREAITGIDSYEVTYKTNSTATDNGKIAGDRGQLIGTYTYQLTAEHGVPYNGGGATHNNLQPYIVCYMWKRIA